MGKLLWSIVGFAAGMTVASLRNEILQQIPAGVQPSVSLQSPTTTLFDEAVATSWNRVVSGPMPERTTEPFGVDAWPEKGSGCLDDKDRVKLAEIYEKAESVFEYGLGESTLIAGRVSVPRYAGVDSDATWVAMARDKAPTHFRFYFADVGATKSWGYSIKDLAKQVYNYQTRPLLGEMLPYDVYMVDGRYRLSCTVLAVLHARARGAAPNETTVLLHDCPVDSATKKYLFQNHRHSYHRIAELFDLVDHSGNKLCVLQRKSNTTDDDLLQIWNQFHTEKNR